MQLRLVFMLRCEPTGPAEGRPEDRLREPRSTHRCCEPHATLTERCAELDLRVKTESAAVEIAAYLATLAAHYRLTGTFKDS